MGAVEAVVDKAVYSYTQNRGDANRCQQGELSLVMKSWGVARRWLDESMAWVHGSAVAFECARSAPALSCSSSCFDVRDMCDSSLVQCICMAKGGEEGEEERSDGGEEEGAGRLAREVSSSLSPFSLMGKS